MKILKRPSLPFTWSELTAAAKGKGRQKPARRRAAIEDIENFPTRSESDDTSDESDSEDEDSRDAPLAPAVDESSRPNSTSLTDGIRQAEEIYHLARLSAVMEDIEEEETRLGSQAREHDE